MERRTKIFGHRGSMATHPENRIPGFLHAMAVGADGVELDVAVANDGRLVVTHEVPVDPTDNFPLLDEVLALASPSGFVFDVEAKGFVPADLLLTAIRRARHDVIVRSFDHEILRAVHRLAPDITIAALIESSVTRDWVEIASEAGASIISPHYSAVSRDRVERAHAASIEVSVWTVNLPDDWLRFAGMGVDTIITNDPGAAVRYFK